MKVLTPSSLRKQIADGSVESIYVVLGDDEYEKIELVTEFESIVEESLRAFNVERFYGGEGSLRNALDAARTVPMLAQHRVVTILRAERWLQPKRESRAATQDLEALENYLDAPVQHSTLVLVVNDFDQRRRISKRLQKKATVVRCGELHDVTDAKRWVMAKCKASGKNFEPAAAQVLASTVGPNVGRLRREIERVLLYATEQEIVTVDAVRAVVGPAVSHDDWAVTRAIEKGAGDVALREIGLALDSGVAPQLLLGQLAWVTRSRLSSGRIPSAVDAVMRTDLALKRSAGEPRVLLERLVVELCGLSKKH